MRFPCVGYIAFRLACLKQATTERYTAQECRNRTLAKNMAPIWDFGTEKLFSSSWDGTCAILTSPSHPILGPYSWQECDFCILGRD